MDDLKIALAQLNFTVGAIDENRDKIVSTYKTAAKAKVDLVVFPELCLTGYPPEDLVLRKGFQKRVMDIADEIAAKTKDSNDLLPTFFKAMEGGQARGQSVWSVGVINKNIRL